VMLLGEGERISEMIAVRMGKENGIELRNFFQGFGASGVRCDPGVYECDLAGSSCEGKGAVAEISDAIAFGIEHRGSPEVGDSKRASLKF